MTQNWNDVETCTSVGCVALPLSRRELDNREDAHGRG